MVPEATGTISARTVFLGQNQELILKRPLNYSHNMDDTGLRIDRLPSPRVRADKSLWSPLAGHN